MQPSMTVSASKSSRNGTLVSFQLAADLREQLERLAKRNERTLSAEIRHALKAHLKAAA